MKLEDKDLAPATSPLVGFNSQPEWPIGKIILPIKAGSSRKHDETSEILGIESPFHLQHNLGEDIAACHAIGSVNLPSSNAVPQRSRSN
ncbi:hypothetical protein CsSME_00040070 [Camellia sinensis var. sinensis]